MRILGLISGTSHDGIDAAVVDFDHEGGHLRGRVTWTASTPYAPDLRAQLVAALPPAPTTLAQTCRLDTAIGQAFAEAAVAAVGAAGPVDAVCSHGQTVYHWVEDGAALGTLQIGQPAWIAERTGVPVVADVRARDLTAGGHGAPLVSFLDELLLRDRGGVPAALNLGGIANMTVLHAAGPRAFDIGPANALVDAVVSAEHLHPAGYDDAGGIAAAGTVDQDLLHVLLDEPYYDLPAPKSTGKEHFNLDYVHRRVTDLGRAVAPADLVATLTALTVATVAAAVRRAGIDFLAVSGGGYRNDTLMAGLRAGLPGVEVVAADHLGAPADSKEAILLALIGWCTLHGLPATAPSATGAEGPRVLGAITPGAQPLSLPDPVDRLRSLTLTCTGEA